MPCFLYFVITISWGTYVLNPNQTCLLVGGPGELGPGSIESIFGLGIGTYNGSGKFRALGHVPLPPPPGSATGSGAEPR